MNCSNPGLPVHHQLPEFTQTHVHGVSDGVQPLYPLSSPSPPALNLYQQQGLFKWVSSLHQVAKYWSFSFNISPSNEHSGLIFGMNWLDLFVVQGHNTDQVLGKPFSIHDQWDRSQDKPCWPWADFGHEHAHVMYMVVCMLSTEDKIILHRVHFCAVKAYGCFASKTVDLSFATDIPQSAYNSALAYQPSNLPL